MHVTRFGFNSIRKLHLTNNNDDVSSIDWLSNIETFEAGKINLFVGRNGSGKSTVIDIIDSLRDASKLPTLQRENLSIHNTSGFLICIGRYKFVSLFTSYGFDTEKIIQIKEIETKKSAKDAVPWYGDGVQACLNCQTTLDTFNLQIEYKNHNLKQCFDSRLFIDELNRIGEDLPGLVSNRKKEPETKSPFYKDTIDQRRRAPVEQGPKEGFLSLWLDDDDDQPNVVPVAHLPSGWSAYVDVLSWLRNISQNSVCLLEEPETHLHPTLQRRLARRIGEIAQDRNLQLFIATHSPSFLNTALWGEIEPIIFQSQSDKLQIVKASMPVYSLLDELGIHASDILQANGIIWVEGPSDRLYISLWLEEWCCRNNKPVPREGIDYTFLFYGGVILSHFTVENNPTYIDMLCLSRNLVIVMDRDLDFCPGSEAPKNLDSTKARIKMEIENRRRPSSSVWITEDYTIEGYLPRSFLSTYFLRDENDRLKPKSSTLSKTEIAKRFRELPLCDRSLDQCSQDLQPRIRALFDAIIEWSR